MGRSDSERAPVLSAMLPSVSARGSAAAVRPPNVVDLTSPRTYAVSPGPDQTWPLDGGEAAIRGLSTVGRRPYVAFRRLGGGHTWPFDGGGVGVCRGEVRCDTGPERRSPGSPRRRMRG